MFSLNFLFVFELIFDAISSGPIKMFKRQWRATPEIFCQVINAYAFNRYIFVKAQGADDKFDID